MSEMKSTGKNEPHVPGDPDQARAGIPIAPGQPRAAQASAAIKLPLRVDEEETITNQPPPAATGAKPSETPPEHPAPPVQQRRVWVLLAVASLLLLVVLFTVMRRPQQKKNADNLQAQQPLQEEKSSLGDYAAVVSKDLLRQEKKYPEIILTDDIFAGQAPLEVKASGPVLSQDIDPQLAALADAFKKRLEISQGSQMAVRGNVITKITKGEFRGFKISAIEKTEDQNRRTSETTIITPKSGVIKSVNHVLETVKETDLTRIGIEIQAAGLEFFVLPDPAPGKRIRLQLRTRRFLGKPVAGELLISGKSVGAITLGMPVAQMEKMFIASHVVLKRKILVKDIYFDVYKILDQSNEPLFYVYENKGKVWGISLISEVFKTEKGIGIGSSLGTMRINYPRIRLGYSEKKTPFVQLEGITGLFIIQGDGIDFSKRVFPNENKIISILIGESPEFE